MTDQRKAGEPVVISALQSFQVEINAPPDWWRGALRIPQGYVLLAGPKPFDMAKAMECGARPATQPHGSLGHVFESATPELDAILDKDHPGSVVAVDATTGKRYMARFCRDCGLGYGRECL